MSSKCFGRKKYRGCQISILSSFQIIMMGNWSKKAIYQKSRRGSNEKGSFECPIFECRDFRAS